MLVSPAAPCSDSPFRYKNKPGFTALDESVGTASISSEVCRNGQVVSGVGGQYNFVAQAHELPGARAILCLRATRGSGRELASNIVGPYGHVTIPRHLRGVVVTEYGVADLLAKTDEEIIQVRLDVADARFQDALLADAKRAGKIDPTYEIPEPSRRNLPERVEREISRWRAQGRFPPFPLGTNVTEQEIALAASLREMKHRMDAPRSLIRSLIRAFAHEVDEAGRFLPGAHRARAPEHVEGGDPAPAPAPRA